MDLNEYRLKIDAIDDELVRLFSERMDIATGIAKYKAENGLPVLDAKREREKLLAIADKTTPELRDYAVNLYMLLFELSRCHQNRALGRVSPLAGEIARALEETPSLFPERAAVACRGGEGSDSQLACERLFRQPNEFFFDSYEAVFSAIEKGLCRYGVLPLENSTAGSVNAVYDLMMRHNFNIVRSVRLKTGAEGSFTRFICISRELEIYPGADRTSLMMILPHRPGSLYKVLSRFYALGINLNKLESRPLPERNFEFMFYFDLENSVYSPSFLQLMGELEDICEEYDYLGSYSEVV